MKTITHRLLASTAACFAVPALAQSPEHEPGPEVGQQWIALGLTQSTLEETASMPREHRLSTRRQADSEHVVGSYVRLARIGTPGNESIGQVAAAAPADSDRRKRLRESLEEVVVTAQKREQLIIDVPISITAMTGAELEAAGIDSLEDLSFEVPSMAVQELAPGRQMITLRGLGSEKGTSSLTGLYLDDVAVSGAQNNFVASYIDLRTTDLERVEVLKGPQGTLFGEGSMGGTVRFITRNPELDKIGGKLSASGYNSSRGGWSQDVSGVLNLPVVENKFGLRMAATYRNETGWIDKLQTEAGPVLEQDFNDNETVDVRLKGLWMPTEHLAIKAMGVVHRSDGGGTNIVNAEPRDRSHFIAAIVPEAPSGYTDDYEIYNLAVTYDFGVAELLSSSSYTNMESTHSILQRLPLVATDAQPNGGSLDVLTFNNLLDASAITQEVRLTSVGAGPLKWTAGAYYKDDELSSGNPNGTYFQIYDTAVFLPPYPAGVQKSDSWAVFGDISYPLTSRLDLGIGVRYFEDERESFDPNDISASYSSGKFDATTFRANLSYEIADATRMYASVSTGFRSGGFNHPAQVVQGAPRAYDPEKVTSYELGTKMNLSEGRINIEAALFYSEWADKQGPSFFVNPNGGLPGVFISNPGEAEIRGFELALRWAATDSFVINVSGDVTDTEITRIDERVPFPSVLVGDPIDFVPDYKLALGGDYLFDWAGAVPGYIRVQYSRQGEQTLTARNLEPVGVANVQEVSPVLGFLNASIGANWRGWDFELFGRNLLDEVGSLSPGYGLHPQARPFTIGLQVGMSF